MPHPIAELISIQPLADYIAEYQMHPYGYFPSKKNHYHGPVLISHPTEAVRLSRP